MPRLHKRSVIGDESTLERKKTLKVDGQVTKISQASKRGAVVMTDASGSKRLRPGGKSFIAERGTFDRERKRDGPHREGYF